MKALTNINAATQPFSPVTLKLTSPVAVANVLGALLAYGLNQPLAENILKSLGLGGYYSGNVREAAREAADAILAEAGLPDFNYDEFQKAIKKGRKSKAGEFVIGTHGDRAPGAASTNFETALEVVFDESEVEAEEIVVTL